MKSVHARNFLTLVGGTVAAQAISILALPILSRIYSPAEYGVLGVYMAVSSLLIVLSTLQYPQAIMLPGDDVTAVQLTALCALIVVVMSVLCMLLLMIFGKSLLQFVNISEYFWILYWIPVSMLALGLSNAFTVLANRHQRYRPITVSRVIASLITVVVSIGVSYLKNGPAGLIAGVIAGQVTGMLILVMVVRVKVMEHLSHISFQHFKSVGREYRQFPIYSLPSEFINILTGQLPIYIISILMGPSVVGLFDRSRQMLDLPIRHISGAVGEVFRQRAASTYKSEGNCASLFDSTLLELLKFVIIPLLAIVFFAPDIFVFVFGKNWRGAGEIAQVLALMYAFKFVVSPLTYMYFIAGKQKEDFHLHIVMIVSSILALYAGYTVFPNSVSMALSIFSINFSLIYTLYLYRSHKLSRGNLVD